MFTIPYYSPNIPYRRRFDFNILTLLTLEINEIWLMFLPSNMINFDWFDWFITPINYSPFLLELNMLIGYFHIFFTYFVSSSTLYNYFWVQTFTVWPANAIFIGQSFETMNVFFRTGLMLEYERVGFRTNPARFVTFNMSLILLFKLPNSLFSRIVVSYSLDVEILLLFDFNCPFKLSKNLSLVSDESLQTRILGLL